MLLVTARRIHTLVGPPIENGALLLRRGRIIDAGDADTLRARAPGAALLDLGSATITPGLTDAHAHLLEWALSMHAADLSEARSPEAAADQLAAGSYAEGEWVRGGRWNPHLWDRAPHRSILDAVLPANPVALTSHDMHSLWCNTAALEAAGIGAGTADPEGGRIERDDDGVATGLLLENATRLVLDRLPAPTDAQMRTAVLEAQRALHRLGVTGVHSMEMGPGFHSLRVFEALNSAGELKLRILQHLPHAVFEAALTLGLRSGFGGGLLRVGALKLFLDGALGSRTAWLRAPYEGTADRGMQVLDRAEFARLVKRAADAGIATSVHAIGDAAVDLAIDVLSDASLPRTALPNRIEHVQLCAPERMADIARAGIICSMQPAHLITDWEPALRHWGADRSCGAYAFRSLLDLGAILAFGSDVPVEPVDPRLGFLAATARTGPDAQPAGGWFPHERLTMDQTLRAYTQGPALAAGIGGRVGDLRVGAEADLAAWDTDPLEAAGNELLELNCVATLVGGDVVWRAEEDGS